MTITSTETAENNIKTVLYSVKNASGFPETEHTLAGIFSFESLTKEYDFSFTEDTNFYPSGWQAWDAGWEIPLGKKQPVYKKFVVPQFQRYIEVPDTKIKKSRKMLLGQFIIYFRNGQEYLVICSTGAFKKLPPVQYAVDLKKKTISIYAYTNGKTFTETEVVSEIKIFKSDSFVNLKNTINQIYYTDRFSYQKTLSTMPSGYESWYNHYNIIDEKIILEDLYALKKTDNVMNKAFIKKNKPVVFQIDDGWQYGTGQWEANKDRFPNGLESITKKIESEGYIPGLWIAPFICDYRLPFIQAHKDWLLLDKTGKPLEAGFNPSWGGKKGALQPGRSGSYYALDLSIPEVIDHIDEVMETLINRWGFRYIKLDFLFAGLLNGDFKNKGAAFQHYENALQVVTKRKTNKDGKPVYYLGCGQPFESSFLHLPLSRIGTDTLEHWDRTDLKILDYPARPSAYVNLKDTLSHAFWNNSIFQNDPDVIFARKENCSLTDDEKLIIAFVNYVFGSQIMYSDDPASFSESEIQITEKICKMFEQYEGLQWSLEMVSKDVYNAISTDGNHKVIIDLKKRKINFS